MRSSARQSAVTQFCLRFEFESLNDADDLAVADFCQTAECSDKEGFSGEKRCISAVAWQAVEC